MVTIDFHETFSYVLTQEGTQIALEGSHEARVWSALPTKGGGAPLTVKQLQEVVGKESASVGQGRAFKAKWIGKEGNGFVKLVRPRVKVEMELHGHSHVFERSLRLKTRHSWSSGK